MSTVNQRAVKQNEPEPAKAAEKKVTPPIDPKDLKRIFMKECGQEFKARHRAQDLGAAFDTFMAAFTTVSHGEDKWMRALKKDLEMGVNVVDEGVEKVWREMQMRQLRPEPGILIRASYDRALQ